MINSQLYKTIGDYAKRYAGVPNVVDRNDPSNRDKLICKNMRLAVDLAMKAAAKYGIDGDELDELIGEGMKGLCVAYDKYDTERAAEGKAASYSSVAWFWSNAYITAEVKKIIDRRNNFGELDNEMPEARTRNQEKWELLFDGIGETDIYIMELRHGLSGEKPMTLREITKRTGFQCSVIKKAVASAMDKMKANCEKYNIHWSDIMPS